MQQIDLNEHRKFLDEIFSFIEKIQAKSPKEISTLMFFLDEFMQTRSKWGPEIPWIQWPYEWEVKSIPSYSGLLRFNIRLKSNHDKWTSIYLDGYDMLGYYGEPYWEIYCPIRSECWRYDMANIEGLLQGIDEIFKYDGRPEKTRPFEFESYTTETEVKQNDDQSNTQS